MDEHLKHILTSISDDSQAAPAVDDVLALADEYPFFTLPAIMLLGECGASLSGDVVARLKEQIALNAPDAKTLALLTDPARADWVNFYPEQTKRVTTESVIDTFLDTYGHSSPKEDALLERLIFNPTPDYSTLLAREEEESLPEEVDPSDNSQDALINAFILGQRTSQQRQPVADAAPQTPKEKAEVEPLGEHPQMAAGADNSSLTESLAKIYIKQKRYDKAFEIIHTLSLKNPKKSAYFADQLRFLRKLMLLQQLNGK